MHFPTSFDSNNFESPQEKKVNSLPSNTLNSADYLKDVRAKMKKHVETQSSLGCFDAYGNFYQTFLHDIGIVDSFGALMFDWQQKFDWIVSHFQKKLRGRLLNNAHYEIDRIRNSIFVFGDVHGTQELPKLWHSGGKKMLKLLDGASDNNSEIHSPIAVVFNGDIADRGPCSLACWIWIMATPRCLVTRGNHEAKGQAVTASYGFLRREPVQCGSYSCCNEIRLLCGDNAEAHKHITDRFLSIFSMLPLAVFIRNPQHSEKPSWLISHAGPVDREKLIRLKIERKKTECKEVFEESYRDNVPYYGSSAETNFIFKAATWADPIVDDLFEDRDCVPYFKDADGVVHEHWYANESRGEGCGMPAFTEKALDVSLGTWKVDDNDKFDRKMISGFSSAFYAKNNVAGIFEIDSKGDFWLVGRVPDVQRSLVVEGDAGNLCEEPTHWTDA